MGEQSAARLEGDRYQHLYSWYILLSLLDENSPYEYGYVEHPTAGATDDVTLHPKPGAGVPSKFYQVKWHVNQRDSYSFKSLVTIVSGTRSLIHKLFDSWKPLHSSGAEVWLVSNWASAPEVGRYIREREHKFSDEFFSSSSRTIAGKGKKEWRNHLGASEDELHAFCHDLRLRLGFAGIRDLEEMVDDRMARYGLRTGEDPRALAIDEVSKWIEVGGVRKKITREVLQEAISRRHLCSAKVDEPQVSIWIHGWAKRAYDRPPTVELDWTAYFDRKTRRVPSQDEWEQLLYPALAMAKEALSSQPGGAYIDFRGKLPLTAVLAIGAEFPEVGGYKFRAEQPTRGENFLWRSDTSPSSSKFTITEQETGVEDAQDVLIGLAITGDARSDLKHLFEKNSDKFLAIMYAEPENGVGDGAITGGEDAVALAIDGKSLIRSLRRKYRARRTHLVLYAPATFCLFLGQRLNALGEIVTYERTAAEEYEPSVTIRTT